MIKVVKYILSSILTSRFINGYLVFLFLLSFGLFGFTNDTEKGMLGISNIILLLVPLVCIIFTSINLYNSTDFLRLLLIQPVSRSAVFISYYIAVACSLLYAFIIGVGIPIIFFSGGEKVFVILSTGILLTLVFTSLAFLLGFYITDKVKGIGLSLFSWLYFIVIYDGIMLLIVQAMSDYPVEQYSIALALLNPVDMCRILIMFCFDVSALMGLTGVVLQTYLGTVGGQLIIYGSLLLWIIIPLLLARRTFIRKDF